VSGEVAAGAGATPVHPLRTDPDWRRFLTSRLVSLTGSSVTYVALPVLVYAMTSSPLLTSLVASFEALPYLMLGLPAGALADRFDRKRLMVATDLANALVLTSIPLASWAGVLTVPHVLAVAFVVPTLFVFFDAADFGALPTLVGRERIVLANSALWSSSTVVETLVPLAAGALFAVASPASLLGVDALTYVASALLIRAIRRPLSDIGRLTGDRLTGRALRVDMTEGLRFLWRHAALRTMTVVGATQSICGGAFVGLLVVWADQVLDVREGDWRLGVLFASWGVGMLATTLLTPRVVRRLGAARVTLVALPVSLLMSVVVVLAPEWVSASVATALWGVGYMAVVLNAITYRQQVTPEPLMSRVNTTGRMLSFGLGTPVGAVLGGVVAEGTGPRGGMLAGSAVLALGVVLAWTSPLRREGAAPLEVTA
jgi:MFS family permease